MKISYLYKNISKYLGQHNHTYIEMVRTSREQRYHFIPTLLNLIINNQKSWLSIVEIFEIWNAFMEDDLFIMLQSLWYVNILVRRQCINNLYRRIIY